MERTAPTYAAFTSAANAACAPMAVLIQSAGAASAATPLEVDGALDDLLVGVDGLPAERPSGLGDLLAVLADLLAGGEGG
jgi:hypothetical protein